jgi:hypothetical protein
MQHGVVARRNRDGSGGHEGLWAREGGDERLQRVAVNLKNFILARHEGYRAIGRVALPGHLIDLRGS